MGWYEGAMGGTWCTVMDLITERVRASAGINLVRVLYRVVLCPTFVLCRTLLRVPFSPILSMPHSFGAPEPSRAPDLNEAEGHLA